MKWQDPPKRRTLHGLSIDYTTVQELRENPGRTALLFENITLGACNSMKTRAYQLGLKPHQAKKAENLYDLYAMWPNGVSQ